MLFIAHFTHVQNGNLKYVLYVELNAESILKISKNFKH